MQPERADMSIALWEPIDTAPEHEIVLTKVDDENGPRNIQKLKRHGKLWFLPGGTIYVYYSPTHWSPSQ